MNTERQTIENKMPTADAQHFSNRQCSLVLFLAVLVGIAQFGLGQFSVWVLAAPFLALLFMDLESMWKAGSGSQALAGAMTSGGVLSQAVAALVFHGVVIGALMTAASGAGGPHPGTAGTVPTPKSAGGGCGSGGMCGGGPATAALAKTASSGGCGSGGCGSSAGGCGSGGCGAGGSAASSAPGAKTACGCGSTGKTGTLAVASPGVQSVPMPGAVPAMPNANTLRPSLPQPIMPRPGATAPGLSNPPVTITPQAMAIISAQPQTSLPRPAQGPASPPAIGSRPSVLPSTTKDESRPSQPVDPSQSVQKMEAASPASSAGVMRSGEQSPIPAPLPAASPSNHAPAPTGKDVRSP